MATETEIKVEVDAQELELIRQRLEREGTLISPRQEELNVLYDRDGKLEAAGCTLRLRSYAGQSILTFKGPLDTSSPFKTRPEFQTAVDGTQMRQILAALGYEPRFRYDKWREVRHWDIAGGQVEVCLDETPVGLFVEIEGEACRLEPAARRLGWARGRFIKRSYVELYRERLGDRKVD